MSLELPPSDEGSEPPPVLPSSDDEVTPNPEPSPRKKRKKKSLMLKRPATMQKDQQGGRKFLVHDEAGLTMNQCLFDPKNYDFDFKLDEASTRLASSSMVFAREYFFWEIWCPVRVSPYIADRGPTLSLDLQTGWDLSMNKPHWQDVLKLQKDTSPTYLMACPPRTAFSTMQYSNWFRRPSDEREKSAREGCWHLSLSCHIISQQVANGKFFIFEHPHRAASWKTPVMQRILELGQCVEFDQCQCGLRNPSGRALKKRTVLFSNIPQVIKKFAPLQCKGCEGGHGVVVSVDAGSTVSKWSQVYPPVMCQLIGEAVSEHAVSQTGELTYV